MSSALFRLLRWFLAALGTPYCAPTAGLITALDAELRQRNSSVRAAVKEIPSVFGSFF